MPRSSIGSETPSAGRRAVVRAKNTFCGRICDTITEDGDHACHDAAATANETGNERPARLGRACVKRSGRAKPVNVTTQKLVSRAAPPRMILWGHGFKTQTHPGSADDFYAVIDDARAGENAAKQARASATGAKKRPVSVVVACSRPARGRTPQRSPMSAREVRRRDAVLCDTQRPNPAAKY